MSAQPPVCRGEAGFLQTDASGALAVKLAIPFDRKTSRDLGTGKILTIREGLHHESPVSVDIDLSVLDRSARRQADQMIPRRNRIARRTLTPSPTGARHFRGVYRV